MSQIDLFKSDRAYYKAGSAPVFVSLPTIPFLTIEGDSPIKEDVYWQKWDALQKLGFAIRNVCREEDLEDFVLPRLEGIYPAKSNGKKGKRWRLMMRLPDHIDKDIFKKARKMLDSGDTTFANEIKFEMLDEGTVAQIMHVGPRDEADSTIARLNSFIESQHYTSKGPRHEIYISDPQKVDPERNKTILRFQVERS